MAANTKIQYSVGLSVDTAQAKQDMNELLNSISKISRQAIVSFDTRQIKEGISAARELETHLTKAFDVKTGNLDLSKFSASMRESNSSLDKLASKLQSFGPSGQAAFNSLANAINNAQVPLKRTSTMIDNLMINLKKTAQWQLSSTIIHGAQAQISSAINYVKNLNKSLTNIAIVSDLSTKQLADFAVSAQKMGKSLATSTLDVTNAALIYFQQGDSIIQSMEKAAITIKAANASANSSAAEMSEYLTAIWNSYQVGSAELEKYVDIMAALGAKTASSMEEIATAMQKVAATANTVGVGFDQMSSIISTVSSVTRESAESIGTSYKTILARIGDLKIGELVEDGVSVNLGLVSNQLKKMGVNILDAKGNMRDMGSVIEEIGTKWQTMNDAQKAAVAQTIAGKRQYTQLMALFENWDKYQENMTISANSEGALNEMQNTWATGWEAASNRVRNAMEGIYASLIDDSVVTGFLNVIAEIIGGIDKVIDKMGGLGGVVTMVGGLFATSLGGRTTELIDALKNNLGLMTGATKKQMIESNKAVELWAAKQENDKASEADKVHYGAMKQKSLARATYLKNQDRLSLEERATFDAKSKQFDEVAAEKEAVETEKAKLERQNNAEKRKRAEQFKTSDLIQLGDPSEASANASAAAEVAIQQAQAAHDAAKAAHEKVVAAQAEQDAVQAELDALTAQALQAEQERDAKLEAASKNNDEGGQRGLLRQAQAKEDELTELNAQIEAKRAELEEAKQKVDEAKATREEKNEVMKQKKRASRQATKQAKELVKDNDSTKALKQLQTNLRKELKGTQVEVKLDELIKFQEMGKSTGELKKAGERLFKEMEQELLDSAKKANLGEQLNNIIGAKTKDVDAMIAVDGDGTQEQVTAAKTALQDLQTLATSTGFTVELDIEGITTLGEAKGALESIQSQIAAAGAQAGASEAAIAQLMEAFGIDPAAVESIREAGAMMGELEGRSAELSGSLEQLGSDMEGAAIPTTTTLDALTSLTGGILTVIGAIQTLTGAWDTILDADATPIEKATAAFGALAAILGVVSTVTQAAKTINDAHVTSLAKKLAVSKGLTLEEAKSQVVKTSLIASDTLHQAIQEKGIITALKEVAVKKLQTAANVGETASLWAKITAKIAELALSGPKGWAILAAGVAITAAATVGIIAATNAIINKTQAQQKLNEEIANCAEATKNHVNAINTLKSDLASLASILANTSLSYEEQLTKINEVTSAYGVQATMLEVLSGNYAGLEARMREAALGQAMLTAEEAKANQIETEKLVQQKVNSRTQYTEEVTKRDANGYAYTTYETKHEDYFNDVNTADTHKNDSWFFGVGTSSANTSMITDAAWTDYGKGRWHNGKRDDNLTGIIREDMLSSGKYYNEEGQAWLELQNSGALEELGFYFDAATATLKELEAGKGNAAGLMELLDTTTVFDGLDLADDSYTKTIQKQLADDGWREVLNTRQVANEAELVTRLLDPKQGNFDFMGLGNEDLTFEDINNLIKTTVGTDKNTTKNREFLANYLTGFGHSATGAMQYTALSELATKAVNAQDIQIESTEEQHALEQKMMDDLIAQLDDEFTIDALLKINPTDIVLSEDANGNQTYTIKEEAKALAQAQVNTDKAKEKQNILANTKNAATATVISRADYTALQESGLFESDEALREFVSKGATERAALWEQMNEKAVNDEIAGLEEQARLAEASLSTIDQEINDWYDELEAEMAEKSDDSDLFKDLFDANGAALEGEALYQELSKRRAKIQGELSRWQEMLAAYEALGDDATDDQKKDFIKKYGLKDDNGNELSVDDLGEWETETRSSITTAESQIDTYDSVLDEGDALLNKKAYNTSVLEGAESALDAAKYWKEVGAEIEKAAKGAEAYANAIGKQGEMSADDLAWMTVQDPEALTKYREATADEWNKYAYEQSMQYYDNLLLMYNEDSVEYAMALQQKQNAADTYYNTLEEKAKTAAEEQQKVWEEERSAAESAMNISNSLMGTEDISFKNIETLKQDLIDAGVEAERAKELIENIYNAGSKEEQIKASMVAATEAALAKVGSLKTEQKEYVGIVTSVDTSQVEPVPLKMQPEAGSLTSGVTQAVEDADGSKTVVMDDGSTITGDITSAVENADGSKTVVMDDGSTITGDIVSAVENADGSKTITFDDGSTLSGDITSAIVNADGTKTVVMDDGSTITGDITSAVQNADGSKTITFADGSTLSGDITSAVQNADGSKTVVMDDGSTITGDIVSAVQNADGSKTITYADGSTLSGDITSAITNADGTKTVTLKDGSTFTGAITSAVQNADGSKTITFADGSTLSGDIATAVQSADGSKTVTLKDGSTFTGEITSAVTLANGSKQITYADGSTLVGDMESAITNANGSKTVTLKDGSTFTGEITSAVQDANGTKTITFADNSTLQGSISSAVQNADGTKTVTLENNGLTLQGNISSAVNGADGSVEITMDDGSKTSLPAEVVTALSANGKKFDVNAYLANPETLQETLNSLNLTTEVEVKVNLSQRALDEMKSRLMSGLSNKELKEMMSYSTMTNEELFSQINHNDSWFSWAGGEKIKWSKTETAALTEMVSNFGSMSPEEIAAQLADPNSILNSLFMALNNAIEHGDAETKSMATFLLQGLGSGLADGCASFNWDAYLTNLGPEVVEAFKAALGIHSPSELTKALAPFLTQGLAVGLAEADATFELAPLTGIRSVIAERFQEAIQGAIQDNGTLSVDALVAAGFDRNIATQYAEHYNGIAAMEGDTWEEKQAAYINKLQNDAVTAHLTKNGVKTEEEYIDKKRQEAITAERERLTGHASGMGSAEIERQAAYYGEQAALAAQDELAGIRQSTEDAFKTTMTNLPVDLTEGWEKNYLSGKYLEDDKLSATQKNIITGAINAALARGGWKDIDQALADGGELFYSYVQENLDNQGQDLQLELATVWSELQDIWSTGLSKIYTEETELAKKTYELWTNTFNAIANARQGLLEGKSILESMFGTPDEVAYIIESYLNQGKTMAEILTILRDPNASVNFTPWDAEVYHKAGKQRFLNRNANGQYIDTTVEDYNKNVRDYVNTELRADLNDVIAQGITQKQIDAWATSTDPVQQALLAELVTQGVVNNNDGVYTLNTDAQGNLVVSLDDGVITQVLSGVASTLTLDTQAEVNNVLGTAAATQNTETYKRANTMRKEGQTFMQARTSDQTLLTEARQALMEGKSLSDTFNEAEQARLLKLTGAADLTGVNLNNLDSATLSLTNTMVACSQRLAAILPGVENGSIVNYTMNTATGEITSIEATGSAIAAGEYTLTEAGQAEYDADFNKYMNEYWAANIPEGHGILTDAIAGMKEHTRAEAEAYAREKMRDTAYEVQAPTYDATNADQVDEYNSFIGDVDPDALNTLWQSYADGVGRTKDEFQDLARQLYKTAEGEDTLLEQNAETQQSYMQLAQKVIDIENAWSDLTGAQTENIALLKTGQKQNTKYSSALKAVTKDIKKIFGDSLNDTEKFVEDNAELIEKMAKGEEGAAEAVEEAFLRAYAAQENWNYDQEIEIEFDIDHDGVVDQLTTIGELLNNFGDEHSKQPVGFKATLDNTPALAGLQSLLDAGSMTVDQMNAALAGIGWEPEITWEPVTVTNENAQTLSGYAQVGDEYVPIKGNMSEYIGQTVYVPKIGSAKKTGGGASGLRPQADAGGGGGGGGGEPKQLEKKDPNDEKERYHEINERLDRMSQLLDKINKYKDRAFGKSHLKNLEQEIKLMKQQEGMYERKLAEAKEWLEYDKGRLAEFGVTFDEMGNINNYDEVMEAAVAEYNAFVDRYNAMSADEQKTSDENEEQKKAEEKLENLKEYIDDYEESINNIYDLENQILETQNKQSALMLEKIQYKAEYQIEINEDDIELLEYFDEKWEEVLDKQDDRLAGMIEQGAELHDTLSLLATEQQELDAAYAAGKINLADYVEGLREVKDSVIENLEAFQELQETINELYGDTLEMVSEKVEEQTEHINTATEAMGSYITILGLMGRGKNFRELETFYAKQVEYSLENAKAQRQHLDLLLQEKEYYDAIIASGEELNDTQKIWYQDLLENIDEVSGELLSSTEEVLNNIASEYENVINGIFKELDEVMGGAAGSLAGLADQYSYYTETQERYVTSAKELYEVSKLNRDIERSIEDSTTTASKQMLAALKERINAQSELNELTEYDIEMNRLQYELALAKIGLEEAQNAKDTVRLTRDESGNYVYQYTANDDKINEAEQKYEDVLQQINELAYNRVTELEQMFLDAQQQYYDAAQEIANDTTLTTEERTIKLQELYSRFCETQQYIQEQYQNATGHIMESNTTIAAHYNDTLTAQAMNSRENINETIAGMIEDNETYKESFREAIAQINEAQDEQKAKMDEVAAATKLDYVSMTAEVGNYDQAVKNAGNTLSKVLDGEGETAGMLEQIHTLGEAWDGFAKTLAETVIPKFETLLQNIVDTIRELANLEDTVNNTDLTPPDTGNTDTGTDPDTDNDNDNPGGGGNPSPEKTTRYKVVGTYERWTPEGYGTPLMTGTYSGEGWDNTEYGARATAQRKAKEKGGSSYDYKNWSDTVTKYKTGGLADFTGPAWLDGTKSSPELVLNATDTQNMLTAIGTLRELDTDTIAMLVSTLNAATASLFGALSGNYHAAGVSNTNTQELNQNVEIHADFPNVTDRNEIVEAIDDLVNRAAQFAQKKVW